MSPRPLPLRTRAAVAAGAVAGGLSRALGRGAGATLPGKVTLAVAPDALRVLADGRTTAIVTGTNGKTTTTAFLVAALGGSSNAASDGSGDGGPEDNGAVVDVVTNATGANLPTGIVSALARSSARTAVLETDELHVPAVARATEPVALVLLNLSRDQLDRTHEVRRAVDLWRETIGTSARPLTVVANATDPNVAYAVLEADPQPTEVAWVDGALAWLEDAELCPRCGTLLIVGDSAVGASEWRCDECGLRQPDADYRVVPGEGAATASLLLPDGSAVDLAPALPGSANLSNAAFAVAAAHALGVDHAAAAARLSSVRDVAGRYSTVRLGTSHANERDARLLLAKNPAGWTVALDLIDDDAVIALGVNARTADGKDTSWLWDVPFERLAGRTVGVFGDRVADLELRLIHAGVRTQRSEGDLRRLAVELPSGELTVLATYTAFEEVRRGVF